MLTIFYVAQASRKVGHPCIAFINAIFTRGSKHQMRLMMRNSDLTYDPPRALSYV